VDELGDGGRLCLCLLLTAWSGVLWCGLRMAVMFVGGGAASRVLGVFLPDCDFQYPCMLKESGLPPTGPVSFDPGSFLWRWKRMVLGFLFGLRRLTMVRFTRCRSSSPASMPLQMDRKARQRKRSSRCVHFFSCMLIVFCLMLVVYPY
jgi:hypothetical protein